jgi:eukaryotic-like serine/threonine-protein kinase
MNIGDQIGDYEVLDVLGAGGMGKVYKVRNMHSDRVEAMKILLPHRAAEPGLAERFSREIKVHAALDHPNIARMNTAQLAGSQLVMVMEYVQGTSLDQVLAARGLELNETLAYSIEILNGLAYAHQRGVVHRDIKPANIMLTHDHKVKLMDFGIARMKTDRRLTQTGLVVGSLPYISPEQIHGAEPDARSDIYSFGVMLYEMAAMRRPFQADSQLSLMNAHLREAAPPPIEFAPDLPHALNDAILKALAKEPQARFQTAEEFRRAIAAVQIHSGSVANPSSIDKVTAATQAPFIAEEPPPPPAAPSSPARSAVASAAPSRRWSYVAAGSALTACFILVTITGLPRRSHTSAKTNPNEAPVNTSLGSQRRGEPSLGSSIQLGGSTNGIKLLPPTPAEIASRAAPGSDAQMRPDLHQALAETKELHDRLLGVEARAEACDALLRPIRNQLAADGLALNPAFVSAQSKARAMIEQGKSEIAAGYNADAEKSLDAAEAALRVIEARYMR